MIELWEVLVPTVKNPNAKSKKKRYYRTRYHKIWDAKVIAIAGGQSILTKIKGKWMSSKHEMFDEEMIPVRIACTRDQIRQIIRLVSQHYSQKAVMCYKISEEVIIEEF